MIAALYKKRWAVELFFKWIKQTLRIKHFYGTSELVFGLFRRRERVHFPFGSRYGAEFLYCLGLAGT
jgi:IS4 transposase